MKLVPEALRGAFVLEGLAGELTFAFPLLSNSSVLTLCSLVTKLSTFQFLDTI